MSTRSFETIAVVGAGTMGAQIALQCAVHHYPVRLYSRSAETLQRAAHLKTHKWPFIIPEWTFQSRSSSITAWRSSAAWSKPERRSRSRAAGK